MFIPDQAVIAGTDMGRVMFHNTVNKEVSVMIRLDERTWVCRSFPEDTVLAAFSPLNWSIRTPFESSKAEKPVHKSWIASLWNLLAA